MADKKPVIELRDVWKIYKLGAVDIPALRGLNLRVYEGDFLAIMGPSGSGKSTLMYLIGCLDMPTKGKVLLEGRDITKLRESDLAQIRGQKIGFVFQAFNLLPGLTALENVALPMTFQDIHEEKKLMRAKVLLAKVGLSERANHRPAELSGGEQQRVAIARALANDPEVILADEPTGNLDSATGKQVMDLLIDLHKKAGKTVIIITHDPYIASRAARMLPLKDGRLVTDHRVATKVLWAENRIHKRS